MMKAGRKNTLITTLGIAALLATGSCTSKRDTAFQVDTQPREGGIEIVDAPLVPGRIALVTFDQILNSMASVAGVTPSTATQQYADRNRTSFSLNGNASEITSGMWMSVTTLAGYVCQDLFTAESARPDGERVYYRGVNFAGGPFTARNEVIRRLTLGAWSRLASSAELADFDTALSGAGLSGASLNAQQTQNALLLLCTGAFGSLAAHVR